MPSCLFFSIVHKYNSIMIMLLIVNCHVGVTKWSRSWESKIQTFDPHSMHTLEEIVDFMLLLKKNEKGIGEYGYVRRSGNPIISTEGRNIPFMNVTLGDCSVNPGFLIIGGILGNEWTSVNAVLALLKDLYLNFDDNRSLFQTYCWIFIPVLNVDGFSITQKETNMRNWSKNMAKPSEDDILYIPNSMGCYGVNLNFNFEFQSEKGSEAGYCDENFGHYPLSQNESIFIDHLMKDERFQIRYFVAVRQGMRAITYPTRTHYDKGLNWKVDEKFARNMAQEATGIYGRQYESGHCLKFQKERSSGEITDWAKMHFSRLYVYTFYVSTVTHVADITHNELEKSCREFSRAIRTVIKQAVDHYILNVKPNKILPP